jgi:hypothetical protein
MVSSKDIEETKKICAGIRQMNKEVLDHLYAQAAETGHYLTPDKAIYQLYQLLQVVVIGNQPPMTLAEFQRSIMRKQDAIDLEAWLGSRLFRDTYHDAVDAYFRHRPGLEIKKGKAGRKAEIELAERIWKLKAEGRTVPQMQAIFKAEGQHYSREKIESYLKTRRKSLK